MQINNLQNLLELFFEQYKLQNKNEVFLQPLRIDQKSFTWEETFKSIIKLSEEIKKINNNGDRCLLISENRPEWMISDLAIMLSGSITVPAYTTYIEKDYEYIIQDCTPKVLIISNKDQFSKVKNIINEKSSIKKIISFEDLELSNDIYTNFKDIISNINNLKLEVPHALVQSVDRLQLKVIQRKRKQLRRIRRPSLHGL